MSRLKVQVLEGADNKLDLAKLKDVLKRKLIIPSYQRPYAWTEEDIEDIFQTIQSTKEYEENICFFGSIILSKKENGNGLGQEEYYIIDGQQRLSSFLLILRVVLNQLSSFSLPLQKANNKENNLREQIAKELSLNQAKKNVEEIIKIVNLTRIKALSKADNEKSILNFIKNSGDDESLPSHLKEKVNKIKNQIPDSSIDAILIFLDLILNKVKFCLISISGENSENFAINLFNTLNTTGQPLTAFEVLKSELYIIDAKLSDKVDEIQNQIIKKYTLQRKKITTHTGKLLLYLALYRGDFDEDGYTLSDKKFKDQRKYLTQVLKPNSAQKLVEDIKDINDFYSKYWLNLNSLSQLLENKDEQVSFQFLSELKHDRVLPILIRFYKNNKELLGECVKICTAFSSLWRAFHDSGTAGIDNSYKKLSKKLKKATLEDLRKELKILFLKDLQVQTLKEARTSWMQKIKTSTIYKNQKLSKFLLFVAYNKLSFNDNTLQKGRGIDILDTHYWTNSDYKTIEHIIPKSDSSVTGIHTLGNLTLLPQVLNSSMGNKPFSEKLKHYKEFCSTENHDRYPYLPLIKHIASYDNFEQKEIEERSKILSQFIWKTLVENWLKWKA